MRRFIRLLAIIVLIVFAFDSAYALPDVGEEPPGHSPVGMDISGLQAEELYGNMSSDNLFSDYELSIMLVWVVWSGASDTCMRLIEEQRIRLLAQNINCFGVYYEDEQHPVTTGRKYYEEKGYSVYSITNRKSPILNELFDNTDSYLPIMYFVTRSGIVRGFASGYLTNYELNRIILYLSSNSNIVTFIDGTDNSVIYQTIVTDGGYTYYPNVPEHDMYKFKYWDKPCVNITDDTVITAVYDRVGDANFDGKINTGDAALVLRYSVGIVCFTEYTQDVADFNRSGSVNTGDAVALLRYIAGMG